jgi:hypothetical protein
LTESEPNIEYITFKYPKKYISAEGVEMVEGFEEVQEDYVILQPLQQFNVSRT